MRLKGGGGRGVNAGMSATLSRATLGLCFLHLRRYFVQGGDWGGIVANTIGQIDGTRCLGLHLNFFPMAPTPWLALVGIHTLSPEDFDKAGYPLPRLASTIMVSLRVPLPLAVAGQDMCLPLPHCLCFPWTIP
jgi:hypothetical protein